MSVHIPSIRELERALRDQGWEVRETSKGHRQATPPDPAMKIVTMSDPGDFRAWKNMLAQLRHSGFIWGGDAVSDEDAVAEVSAPETPAPDVVLIESDVEKVFRSLKEARDMAQLAKEEALRAKQATADANRYAQKAADAAESAMQELAARKAAFDAAFKL